MEGVYTRAFPTLFTAFRLLVGIPLMKKTHRQDFCQLCLNFYPKIWTWICLFTLSLFANSMHFIDLLICTSVARWRPLKINTSWPTSSLFAEHHNILSVFYFFFKRTILENISSIVLRFLTMCHSTILPLSTLNISILSPIFPSTPFASSLFRLFENVTFTEFRLVWWHRVELLVATPWTNVLCRLFMAEWMSLLPSSILSQSSSTVAQW